MGKNNKNIYTVRKWDTLYKIAKSKGISLNKIKKLNPKINYDLIKVDQKIRVK